MKTLIFAAAVSCTALSKALTLPGFREQPSDGTADVRKKLCTFLESPEGGVKVLSMCWYFDELAKSNSEIFPKSSRCVFDHKQKKTLLSPEEISVCYTESIDVCFKNGVNILKTPNASSSPQLWSIAPEAAIPFLRTEISQFVLMLVNENVMLFKELSMLVFNAQFNETNKFDKNYKKIESIINSKISKQSKFNEHKRTLNFLLEFLAFNLQALNTLTDINEDYEKHLSTLNVSFYLKALYAEIVIHAFYRIRERAQAVFMEITKINKDPSIVKKMKNKNDRRLLVESIVNKKFSNNNNNNNNSNKQNESFFNSAFFWKAVDSVLNNNNNNKSNKNNNKSSKFEVCFPEYAESIEDLKTFSIDACIEITDDINSHITFEQFRRTVLKEMLQSNNNKNNNKRSKALLKELSTALDSRDMFDAKALEKNFGANGPRLQSAAKKKSAGAALRDSAARHAASLRKKLAAAAGAVADKAKGAWAAMKQGAAKFGSSVQSALAAKPKANTSALKENDSAPSSTAAQQTKAVTSTKVRDLAKNVRSAQSTPAVKAQSTPAVKAQSTTAPVGSAAPKNTQPVWKTARQQTSGGSANARLKTTPTAPKVTAPVGSAASAEISSSQKNSASSKNASKSGGESTANKFEKSSAVLAREQRAMNRV